MPAEHKAKLNRDIEVSSTTLAFGQYLPGTGFRLRTFAHLIDEYIDIPPLLHKRLNNLYGLNYLRLLSDLDQSKINQLPLTPLIFTNRDVARWNMAWRTVQTCKLVGDTDKNGVTRNWGPDVERLRRILTERCDDWPTFDDLTEWPIRFGFSVAAFIYGGLHASAWFAHFNSNTEQLLWRASACIVMGGFPVTCIMSIAMSAAADEIEKFQRSHSQEVWMQRATGSLTKALFALWCVFISSIAAAYILARAYLVVECFINLSHLPAGAYDVPNWSAYFPHIS